MKYIIVDVESDGPCPGLYSMHEFGAVVVGTRESFHSLIRADKDASWNQEALDVCNRTREETLSFPEPSIVIPLFVKWLKSFNTRLIFVSDNNGYDWQFINYYLWKYAKENPFGHSSMNLGSLYKGLSRDMRANFKFLRKTKHDHNALNDCIGNAEAMETILGNFK